MTKRELRPLPGHPQLAAPPAHPAPPRGLPRLGMWGGIGARSCCRWPGRCHRGDVTKAMSPRRCPPGEVGIVPLLVFPEGQESQSRILVTPAPLGLVEQLPGGPWVPIASCHIPTAPGGAEQLLLLGEDALVFAVGRGILGTCSPSVPWEEFRVPSAFQARRGCLIYCSLLGNGEGGELGIPGVEPGRCSPLLPKKVPSPFAPSLAPRAVGALLGGWLVV